MISASQLYCVSPPFLSKKLHGYISAAQLYRTNSTVYALCLPLSIKLPMTEAHSSMDTLPQSNSTVEIRPNNVGPAIPEDGYEWRKYGQKYISSIGKNRSYFKCRDMNCRVMKKRVEWSPSDPSNLRIVYDGTHNHPSPSSLKEDESSTSTANQYHLANQVLRPS